MELNKWGKKNYNSFCEIWTVVQYVSDKRKNHLYPVEFSFYVFQFLKKYTAPSVPVKSFGKMKNCYLEYLKQI